MPTGHARRALAALAPYRLAVSGVLFAAVMAGVFSYHQRSGELTGISADQFASTVASIRAVQRRRDAARRCVSDLKEQLPALMNGKPTLIFLGIDKPALPHNNAEFIYDRWKDRGLNGVWVQGGKQRASAMTVARSPDCLSFIPADTTEEWIVLDRAGQLFWAGAQENRLKQSLWIADPTYTPSPHGTLGGNGLNLLLGSGHMLWDEEAAMIVTWANTCKWYLGQCLFVNSQIASIKRLDHTPPEALAKDGLARLAETGWLDRK